MNHNVENFVRADHSRNFSRLRKMGHTHSPSFPPSAPPTHHGSSEDLVGEEASRVLKQEEGRGGKLSGFPSRR